MNNQPIVIFDDSLGGLYLLKKMQVKFPKENFIYFSDNANYPYYEKSKDKILEYFNKILLSIKKCEPKFIICCSAEVFSCVDEKFLLENKIIDLNKLFMQSSAFSTINSKIGVLGSKRSINTVMYSKHLKNISSTISLHGKNSQVLTAYIDNEIYFSDNDVFSSIIHSICNDFTEQNVDSIIFNNITTATKINAISDLVSSDITVIDPTTLIINEVDIILTKENIYSATSKGEISINFTDIDDDIIQKAGHFYGESLYKNQVNKI